MLNYTLSTIFASLAEMFKNKEGGNFDKVMDFTKAARTIRDYTGDIAMAYSEKIVENLPGITPYAYSLIEEYFKTGKIKKYEDLKEKYSEDLIKFIRISGLGKRRIFHIYEALGAKTINDLKEAVSDGSVYKRVIDSPMPGDLLINKIHIERFIYSLDYYENTKTLFPSGYVAFFIENIKSHLLSLKDIKKIQITGSLRRKKSFIKDIDILLLPAFNNKEYDFALSEKLLKQIAQLGFARKIISMEKRDDNISARYDTVFNIEVEIIISSQTGWSYDLFTTTGSKEHVAAVKDMIAAKTGGPGPRPSSNYPATFKDSKRIKSDAGIFEDIIKNINNINNADLADIDDADKSIYDFLKIQYIEPELRENNGEIGLSNNFNLPKLINTGDIKGDLHIHSPWSDGLIETGELVKKCINYGYEYFAITENSVSNIYGNGLDEARLLEKIKYIEELRGNIKSPHIFLGAEVDITGVGRLDYSDEILEGIDFVLGSMHSNYLNTRHENTARVISAIKNRHVDAIAHPTGVVFGSRAPYIFDMGQIFEAAARYGKALEINSYLLRLDLNDEYVRQFKKMGGKVVIDTDSHRIDNLDMIKLGIDVARRSGLEKDDVINTMDTKSLMKWKAGRSY